MDYEIENTHFHVICNESKLIIINCEILAS